MTNIAEIAREAAKALEQRGLLVESDVKRGIATNVPHLQGATTIIESAIEQAREQDRELIGRLVLIAELAYRGGDKEFMATGLPYCIRCGKIWKRNSDTSIPEEYDLSCNHLDCKAVIARTLIAEAKEVNDVRTK